MKVKLSTAELYLVLNAIKIDAIKRVSTKDKDAKTMARIYDKLNQFQKVEVTVDDSDDPVVRIKKAFREAEELLKGVVLK